MGGGGREIYLVVEGVYGCYGIGEDGSEDVGQIGFAR